MKLLLRILPLLLLTLLVLGFFAGGVTYVLRQLDLYPPASLSIAAGKPGSAYHAIAEAYRDVLARDDIALKIIETNGSLDNAGLMAAQERADIALVQGGIELPDDIQGLAAVRLEPLWIFSREAIDADPNQWAGLRISAGLDGSGTQVIARQLAVETGAKVLETTSPLASADAAGALLAGELDVALFVAPDEAGYLQPLLNDAQLRLITLAHGEAIALRMPGARTVRVPSGVIDYQRPLPAQDMDMIALVTRLVAQDDLHPALVNRLIHAVMEVHSGYPVIPDDRLYPSDADLGISANDYASKLLTGGFSPLEEFLPFWIVAQLNRVLLVLLPAIFLLLPLMRVLPSLYIAFLNRRVYGHYARIHEIDAELSNNGERPDAIRLQAMRAQLNEVEKTLQAVNLPNAYRKQAYELLLHLDYVRRRVDRALSVLQGGKGAPADAPPPL